MTAKTTKKTPTPEATTPKTAEQGVSERFRAALDEVFAAGQAYVEANPSKKSFVSQDSSFKVEFIGNQILSIHR